MTNIKRSSIVLLQAVIALIGIGAFTLLLWEPQIEGVNAHATNFEIYFQDPFMGLVYLGSIPFFVALYQAFKILGYAGRNKIFSGASVKALQIIRNCAVVIIGFVLVEEMFIMVNHGSDDPAGGVFMGLLIIFGSGMVAIVAKVFERILQTAVDIQSENELTV